MFQYIESVAESNQAMLITGETGVGKELFAEAIHKSGGRKGNLVKINIASLDESVFSDTLFGHKKGVFTGADNDRSGLVEKAANGTLLLDEIGDLKPEFQVKLLRLIESREYYPLGSDIPKYSDAKILVATNRDLLKMVNDGSFRKDLFFRFSSHKINIPALRERFDDLRLLVEQFLTSAAAELNKPKPPPPKDFYLTLTNLVVVMLS